MESWREGEEECAGGSVRRTMEVVVEIRLP